MSTPRVASNEAPAVTAREEVSYCLLVDSRNRDLRLYPSAAHFQITLPAAIGRIRRVTLMQIHIPMPPADGGGNMATYSPWSPTGVAADTSTDPVTQATFVTNRGCVGLFVPPPKPQQNGYRFNAESTRVFAEQQYRPVAGAQASGLHLGRIVNSDRTQAAGNRYQPQSSTWDGAWGVFPLSGGDYSTANSSLMWRPRDEHDHISTTFGGQFRQSNDRLTHLEVMLATPAWLEYGDSPDVTRLWPLPDEMILNFVDETFTVVVGATTFTVGVPSGQFSTYQTFFTAMAANITAATATAVTLTFTDTNLNVPSNVVFSAAGAAMTLTFSRGTLIHRIFHSAVGDTTFTVPIAPGTYTHNQLPRLLTGRFQVIMELRVTAERV